MLVVFPVVIKFKCGASRNRANASNETAMSLRTLDAEAAPLYLWALLGLG